MQKRTTLYVKGINFNLEHGTKAQWGSRVIAILFL
jgi:hypothetical protein